MDGVSKSETKTSSTFIMHLFNLVSLLATISCLLGSLKSPQLFLFFRRCGFVPNFHVVGVRRRRSQDTQGMMGLSICLELTNNVHLQKDLEMASDRIGVFRVVAVGYWHSA